MEPPSARPACAPEAHAPQAARAMMPGAGWGGRWRPSSMCRVSDCRLRGTAARERPRAISAVPYPVLQLRGSRQQVRRLDGDGVLHLC